MPTPVQTWIMVRHCACLQWCLGAIFFTPHHLEPLHAHQEHICPPAPGQICAYRAGRYADRGGALAQPVIDPVHVDTFLLNSAIPLHTAHFTASGLANTQAENYTPIAGTAAAPASVFHLYTYLDNANGLFHRTYANSIGTEGLRSS